MTSIKTFTRFGLLRHAETIWNREKKIQGQFDTPLTPAGERQALAWGRRLRMYPWDRILSSDLTRALKTAALINSFLKVPTVSDPRLREQDWGYWTGKTMAQIRENYPEIMTAQEAAGWEFCPPGGEERENVCRRTQKSMQNAANAWPGETILVVAHEGVIKCLVYRLYESQKNKTPPLRVETYFLHWIVHYGSQLRVEQPNAITLNRSK